MTIDATKYVAHTHPGKFEGSHKATEYFWERAMESDGETLGADSDAEHMAELFLVSVEECEAFGLPVGTWVTLYSDNYGFAWITQDDSREAAEARYRAWAGLPNPFQFSE